MSASALARLRAINQTADAQGEARRLYARFVDTLRRHFGMTDDEADGYASAVKILMGKDDDAALNLFPPGLYASADAARQSAIECWRAVK